VDGYWKAPRWLAGWLEEGKLTPTAFAVLAYVATAGADREHGFPTTQQELARLLERDTKTVSRALAQLVALELIEHDLRQGQRRRFRIRLRTRLRTFTASHVSEVMSEVTSPESEVAGRANRANGSARVAATSDTGEVAKNNRTRTIATAAREAYIAAGGVLANVQWAEALERNARSLSRAGKPEELILAASRQLGITREFPGYLKQRAASLEAAGGLCRHGGLDRAKLTREQLEECECNACREWGNYHAAVVEEATSA